MEFLKKIFDLFKWELTKTKSNFKVADKPKEKESAITPTPSIPDVIEIKPEKETITQIEEVFNMYPEGITNHEEKFERTKKDTDGVHYDFDEKKSFTFPLTVLNPKGVTDYYYKTEETKSLIVLHFTVGFLRGDLASLTEQDVHMSTPYVIGRNGTVYELFDPRYWSYHLGRSAVGGNGLNSKRSIAIELSNIGPLTRQNGDLFSIYDRKYCSVDEEEFYVKLETPFRKYTYFSTFTEKQYDSLRELLAYLCARFNIPHEILPENKRYRLFSSKTEAQTYEGICSHVNYRAYGKVDIGPAFEWDKII